MIESQQIQYVKDTFAEYLGKVDYYSASDIKNFLKSPKMFFYDKYTKVKEENQRHFAIGSAVHEMILEPQLFNSNYLVAPKFDKRTKEGKEAFARFQIEVRNHLQSLTKWRKAKLSCLKMNMLWYLKWR